MNPFRIILGAIVEALYKPQLSPTERFELAKMATRNGAPLGV